MVLVCLEVALHFYNPFTARVRNDDVVLPVNMKYSIDLPAYKGMDAHIEHTKNSLGFRGPEPGDSIGLKIIVMGGSTTECFYLQDGKDWPNQLGVLLKKDIPGIWLNNAGADGQSTFGHIRMLKKYILKLKPDYVIFMCGLNDMSLDTPNRFDSNAGWFKRAYNFLEIPNTVVNLLRAGKAREAGLNHHFINDLSIAEKLEMSDSQMMKFMKEEQYYIGNYKKRLKEIISICRKNRIKPIFISQAILFADDRDLFTDVYLGNIKTGNVNGKTRSYILKMYNRISYDVCNESSVPFINLAARLPKDSRFFYDGYHFTNEGSELVAGIIYDELNSRQLIEK